MKRLSKGRLAIFAAAAVLLAWVVWYGRPVNIYGLAPKLKAQTSQINIYMDLYTGGDGEYESAAYTESRTVRLTADTAEGQAVLHEIEGLYFRRDLLNPLRQLRKTNRTTGKFMYDGDMGIIIHVSGREGYIEGRDSYVILKLFGDDWSHDTPNQQKYLPCYLQSGETAGRSLGEKFWEMGQTAS